MDQGTVVYAGCLKKSPPERRLMRTWHKRYFVLKANKTLTYYPSEKDKKPVKDPIDLTYCQSIEANLNHNSKNFKHVFSIVTTTRTYYLVADSQKEMDNWVKHLCRMCGFEKQDGKTSPDFVRNRSTTKSSPKAIKTRPDTTTLPSPMTPSPSSVCPLSMSMPILNTTTTRPSRSPSDPPDCQEMIKRATEQYVASTMDRRRSTEVTPRPNMTLPLRSPDLSQVPECYDPVPPIKSHDIDGGYPFLSQTPGRTPGHTPGRTPEDQGKWFISQPLSTPRPMSQEVYDMVPPCPRPVSQNDDDVYDIPPAFRTPEQGGNYDVVPPPRPVSQSGLYDYVPRYNRNSYNPEETYDMVPCRPNSQGDIYDVPPSTDNYDVVPPPRPTKNLNNSDYYDTLPPPMASEDFQHENNTLLQPPARPPKLSTVTQAKDHYDIVPPPSSRLSKPEELGTENRDSGSYSDEIYDVPPTKPSAANDEIYDTPPRPSDVVYDELPWHREGDECYDTPPAYSGQGSIGNVPPAVNRSIKPSPVNRTVKPADHDYTNLNAPLVDRKCKPVHASRPNDDVHSYENMLPPNNKGTLSKSHSLPESETIFRNCHQTDYCDMQPYRSDDTRCYSFSRDLRSSDDNYEEMDPNALNRESGVHSNSSSEDGETEDCYMTMGPPEQTANPQRKAALQYCEVQIIDGQAKCQMPVPRRDAESHYTTINEESTQAFLQTCRQQQTSRN